jgi:hypothetical protein
MDVLLHLILVRKAAFPPGASIWHPNPSLGHARPVGLGESLATRERALHNGCLCLERPLHDVVLRWWKLYMFLVMYS